MTIGENIRAARQNVGMTQKELGEKAGIAEPTIRRYELGKLNPKLETVKKIAHALGVSWDTLYPEEDRTAEAIAREVSEGIEAASKNGKHWGKMPPKDFIQTFASPQFNSEDDRIVYYYGKLNSAGRAEATRCFFKHLDEQSKKDVADYVQSLTTDTRFTSDTGALLPADTAPHE